MDNGQDIKIFTIYLFRNLSILIHWSLLHTPRKVNKFNEKGIINMTGELPRHIFLSSQMSY